MNTSLMFADLGSVISGSWGIIAVVTIVMVIFLIFALVLSRYTKVGPNQVLVVSGCKHRYVDPDGSVQSRGFRIVKGGGTFVCPMMEKVDLLSLELLTIDVQTPGGLHQQRRAGEGGRRGPDQDQGRRHFHRHRRRTGF